MFPKSLAEVVNFRRTGWPSTDCKRWHNFKRFLNLSTLILISDFWVVWIQALLDFCGLYAVYVRHPDGSFLGLQPQPSSLSGVRPSHLSFSVVFVRPLLPFFRHYYDMPSAVIIVCVIPAFTLCKSHCLPSLVLRLLVWLSYSRAFPDFLVISCVYSYRKTVTRLYFLWLA